MKPVDRPRKPSQTQQRWGKLGSVFPPRGDKEFHALVACLCVLFEDLRIEIAGIAADDLGKLDDCDKETRRLYFQRRSIATLHEFTNVLEGLGKLPGFQLVRAQFNRETERYWVRALRYFQKHKRYVERMRHNVGGHFGKQAAQSALQNLVPEAFGSLELAFYSWGGGGAKLRFAKEIAATATLRNVRGGTTDLKARKMMRHALVAYNYAVQATYCVTSCYLWERFGK